MKKETKENYYIDKEELWQEVDKYYTEDLEAQKNGKRAQMSNTLGRMILDIAQNLTVSKNFSGYFYRDEMTSDVIYNLTNTIHNHKIKLYYAQKGRVIEPTTIKGAKFNKTIELGEGQILVAEETESLKNIQIYELDHERKFLDTDKPVYKKVKRAGVNIISDNESEVEIHMPNFTGKFKNAGKTNKPVFEDYPLYNLNDEPEMVKANIYGYLSLIGYRNCQARIKTESRNKDTISQYQEDEFCKFQIDNPEMQQQKIFDDTGDIC